MRKFNGTGSAELGQFSPKSSITYFDTLSFQVQIEKKRRLSSVTKFNTVHTGVITYQPSKIDWITSTASSESRCNDGQESPIDKYWL